MKKASFKFLIADGFPAKIFGKQRSCYRGKSRNPNNCHCGENFNINSCLSGEIRNQRICHCHENGNPSLKNHLTVGSAQFAVW
ncbi:MAG: hypothetical protein LBQ47_08620, partial [Endomicrobium sp.]|nr:hypothetical protein [Endomicrobium sp.]